MNAALMLGAAAAAVGGITRKLTGKASAKSVANAALGSGVAGYNIGNVAESLAAIWHGTKMRQAMSKAKPDSADKVNALLSHPAFKDVPIYVQDGGRPIGNAFYVPMMSSALKKMRWRNLRTGERVRDNNSIKEKSVYLGSGFNLLPVIAHELGHAHDLRNTGKFGAAAPALLGLATVAGTVTGIGAKVKAATAGTSQVPGNLLLAMGAGTSSAAKSIVRRRERAASDIAIQALKSLGQDTTAASDMLQKAYATYEPIQLKKPDFGSGKYGKI